MEQKFMMILAFFLIGCNSGVGAPISSNSNTPVLTSSVGQFNLTEFESREHGIVIGYPTDWAIESSEFMIYVAPDEEDFLWGNSFSLGEPVYVMYTMGSYVERGNQRLKIPQSAADVAQAIADTKIGDQIINPVTSVSINGNDGAMFMSADGNRYDYIIVLRITNDKAVVLAAHGPKDKNEEMQSLLNAIALSIRPLDK